MQVDIAKPFVPFLNPKRYKVAYGGRGSAKSWTVAMLLILMAYKRPIRVLCARELQLSITESVLHLLEETIERLNLGHFFTVEKTTIYGANGSQFLFSGIKSNITKIKSMEGIDICWIEEAEAVSAASWRVLIPTIRKAGSEIWVTFNPGNILDDTYKRFIQNPPPNSYVVKVNWNDNPWFPDELREEKDLLARTDEELYRHVWEGEPVADTVLSIIKPAWIASAVDAHIKLGIVPSGGRIGGFDVADSGPDANAFIWRHGVVVQHCEEWHDIDTSNATSHVFNSAMDAEVVTVHFDQIGVGAGAKGTSRELIEGLDIKLKGRAPRFEGFNAAAAPLRPEGEYRPGRKNKDQFLNLKAQAWWLLADRFKATHDAIQGKTIDPESIIALPRTLPFLDKLCAELTQPRREFLNGKFRVEPKDRMASRGVVSPNLADALVMAFCEGTSFDLDGLL